MPLFYNRHRYSQNQNPSENDAYTRLEAAKERAMVRTNSVPGGVRALVKNDAVTFQVMLDVVRYKPTDLTVKLIDNELIIDGHHEQEDGKVRVFTRKYILPREVYPESVTCVLSRDGALVIKFDKAPVEVDENEGEKPIPITGPDGTVLVPN